MRWLHDERPKFWHCVMCIGRRKRACKRLSEAAKTLTTRDHVKGISGRSTPLNTTYEEFDASQRQNEAQNTQTTPSNTG
jgi:hypothetical protein